MGYDLSIIINQRGKDTFRAIKKLFIHNYETYNIIFGKL